MKCDNMCQFQPYVSCVFDNIFGWNSSYMGSIRIFFYCSWQLGLKEIFWKPIRLSWCLNFWNISMIQYAYFLFFTFSSILQKMADISEFYQVAHFHQSFSSSERVTEEVTTVGFRRCNMFYRIKPMCRTKVRKQPDELQ